MTDEFTTSTERVPTRPTSVARIGLIGAAAAALVGAAILIFGATAAPSGTLAAASTSNSAAIELPGQGPDDGRMGDVGGGRRFGATTITAISGSSISLETEDGWKRTIAITSATALTKGGATITQSDLKVGDEVRFQQTRQTDGTFTITKLNVVLPHLGGTVTAVSGSTITVTERDGTTGTIKVTSSTTYAVGMTTGKALSDIAVGMRVAAVGTLNSDGSLTATAIQAIDPATIPGPGFQRGHGDGGPSNDGTGTGASTDTDAG
ncbi:MAG: hypothetical protein HYX54_00250 [Chloroflexi bacterium]|nr:hypothetical protein [Chloroflexota bacterium]